MFRHRRRIFRMFTRRHGVTPRPRRRTARKASREDRHERNDLERLPAVSAVSRRGGHHCGAAAKKLHRRWIFKRQPGMEEELWVKPKLQLTAFGSGFRFATNLLRRGFESSQSPYFFHDSFSVELVLKAFKCSIDRLPLTDNDFWHKVFSFSDALAG